MAKHYVAEHPEVGRRTDPTAFTSKVVGQGGIKSNLEKYLTEAVTIKHAHEGGEYKMLNSRGELGRAKLKRLTVQVALWGQFGAVSYLCGELCMLVPCYLLIGIGYNIWGQIWPQLWWLLEWFWLLFWGAPEDFCEPASAPDRAFWFSR